MCLHPTGSHFDMPTGGSLRALSRLQLCMYFHPTGSHFDVPTGESLDALHRLRYCTCIDPTGSRFDEPTGVCLGALPWQPCNTYLRPRDSFWLSKIQGDPAWGSDDTAEAGGAGIQP